MAAQARVPRGVPTGGRYTNVQHLASPVALEDEEARGTAVVLELERLPRWNIALEARDIAEDLRLAYGTYAGQPVDEDAVTVPAARARVADRLAILGPDRAAEWCDLIAFSVAAEMRHWDDPEYAAHPDHAYEQLVAPSDYPEDQMATDANRERWESLTNRAAHAAFIEVRDAEMAYPKAA